MNVENFPPIPFLDLKAQQARIQPGLKARLDAVLAHGQYILGPEVAELEARLAAFCGATHCVSVSSGTDALQIALMAEGIGRGDAVFLPAFTYTATAEVPLLLGATPVFVDVDPRTFQIDLGSLEARIADVKRKTKLRPRAVIGVDLFGQPADWPGIRAIAAGAGMFTLDDCAQSFGGALQGQRLGRAADATATSFFPSKPLGAYGDGGALFTESAERAALYRSLRTHGEGTTRYEVMRIGMNGRLDTMQAAVLLAKLEVFEWEIARREEIARIYDAVLADLVEVPARMPESVSAWAVYSVLLADETARNAAQNALKAAGIASAVYYPRALHQQPAYASCHDGVELPVAEGLGSRILALPIHPDLNDAQARRVAAALRAAVAG
jgi:UDP-2-acetamido-2-deoxy-ribo-hexuluronate aminotransferase